MDFSVSQWKSELLPILGFFPNVCAGFSGDGRGAVRPFLDDGDVKWTQVAQAVIHGLTVRAILGTGGFKFSPLPFLLPQQSLKLKFAAFSHCHNG